MGVSFIEYPRFLCLRNPKSKNGKTYVQIVDKSSGSYNVIKSFGGSDEKKRLHELESRAKSWIQRSTGIQELDFSNSDQIIEQGLGSIDKMKHVGFDHLFSAMVGKIKLQGL